MAIGDVSTSIASQTSSVTLATAVDTAMSAIVSTIGAISGSFMISPIGTENKDVLCVGIQYK